MGGKPREIFSPSISEFIVTIRDTESVQNLSTKVSTSKRVLLIGNGGIATEFV